MIQGSVSYLMQWDIMLLTLPSELIALILNNLEPINVINASLSCKHLYYAAHDQALWKPYLIPALQSTSFHPKTIFLRNIEHCQIQFWHLHPKALDANKSLKFIKQKSWTNIEKARWLLRMIEPSDYIEIIIAIIHPDYRAMFAQDELNWRIMRIILLLVDQHPTALLFFLQDAYYKKACLHFYATEPSFFINFKTIAHHHNALDWNDRDQWKTSFEALWDHMVKTLRDRSATRLDYKL